LAFRLNANQPLVDLAKQNQNQKDDYYQPEASATVIADPIKEFSPNAAKATEKSDSQNNK